MLLGEICGVEMYVEILLLHIDNLVAFLYASIGSVKMWFYAVLLIRCFFFENFVCLGFLS